MDLKHGEGLALYERNGNRRRGNGRRKGGPTLRDPAVIEREHRALTMLVKGHSQKAIALDLDMSEAGVSRLVKRALELRARALQPYVAEARTLLIERYERLLERWWPMATGDYVDPDAPEGQEGVPSKVAVDVVLKIMEALAKITGADRGPHGGAPTQDMSGIHVHIHTPDQREEMQAEALRQLSEVRKKTLVVEGELAKVGTTHAELTGGHGEDKPGPPPRQGSTT